MRTTCRRLLLIAFCVITTGELRAQTAPATPPAGTQPTGYGAVLVDRPLADAVAQLAESAKAAPDDANLNFALGIAQTLRAVENLSAGLYELGPRHNELSEMLPFLRLPLPPNPDPKPVSADALDRVLDAFVADLATARQTLAKVRADDADVKLPVNVLHIVLDLNGKPEGGEMSVGDLLGELGVLRANARPGQPAPPTTDMVIAFDTADACWLRGYTHLLSTMAQAATAFDKTELLQTTGHLLFQKVDGPHAYLNDPKAVAPIGGDVDIVDAIAFVHQLRLPVKDAKKLHAARESLLAVFDESRKSWAAIGNETDNDREWLPGPDQQSVLGVPITKEQADAWLAFLNDGEALLNGQRLIPFWRSKDGRGLNVQKLLNNPPPFDPVLWVQGTAMTPYLEQGRLANGDSFRRLEQLLRGNFMSFVVWVN